MGAQLEDSLEIGSVTVPNRLYRAPLLECAGNGPDAVETLIADLEPAAASGVGLVFQGATIVRGDGGCAAPGMTRVHDDDFVSRLAALTDAIHDHGAKIFVQLEHGGLRSMETWHADYRREHPDLRQLAVSQPPWQLRALDRVGFLDYDPHVMTTSEVKELAADFGQAARRCADAGYDGIHLAGANMGLLHQFATPFYNRRDDRFGDRGAFFELVLDEIRSRAGDVPVVTKVPAETPAPRLVPRHLDLRDGVALAERLADYGYDAVVPVQTNVFWDMSIVRGAYPKRAWTDDSLQDAYADAFGSRWRALSVRALNRLQARRMDFDAPWNADFCRRVRNRVDVPVLCEGGVRERGEMDRLLGSDGDSSDPPAADAVGMARPFYAEPRLAARLLDAPDRDHVTPDVHVVCESCNNCTVPQATGERGVCRTPSVLRERGRLEKRGAYTLEEQAVDGSEAEDGDVSGR
ncbi:NADH:flavin oxidoreductase [Halorubellus sp. JP-L1]|uniref:oxidoreductase n=1 Tax=Halorubellus sp. JP-L1 TaxID=2715753 RepID=UPI00140AEC9D|nr:NADH:flavin oxidoreductase [Halorubellus sp. JP-L1]NHN43445.1 NADH:flavin oxidoreductase [Halorubellus sp. JP-L1]